MARPKIHNYEQTAFAKSISNLQIEHGYTDDYVMEHIVNEFGATLIENVQTYSSYKSGKRKSPIRLGKDLVAKPKLRYVSRKYIIAKAFGSCNQNVP